ncbi:MAG: sensor histidine kinase [Pedococcus sp.]
MPALGGEPPREGADTSQHAAHQDPDPAGARTDAASGPGRKTPRRTHDGYRHEAFFWDGDEEFVCGTVPFIREGLAAGQPVMVAATPPRIEVLRDALDGEASGVEFVDMVQMGANPARIIPAWRRFTDEHAGQPVRGIGEPIWHGRRMVELAECQMHEALLNMAVDTDTPLWLMCPYDTGSLSREVVVEAHRSHPVVVDVETHRGSTTYGGAHHVGTMFETDLPGVQVAVSHRVFGGDDFALVRADVRARASSAGLDAARTADLVLAVHEVAINSVRHGRGASELRIWEQDHSLVCEVRGRGRISDPMVGRRLPPTADEQGRGLWMANQLSDLVQVRSGDAGTTVRIHTWL